MKEEKLLSIIEECEYLIYQHYVEKWAKSDHPIGVSPLAYEEWKAKKSPFFMLNVLVTYELSREQKIAEIHDKT